MVNFLLQKRVAKHCINSGWYPRPGEHHLDGVPLEDMDLANSEKINIENSEDIIVEKDGTTNFEKIKEITPSSLPSKEVKITDELLIQESIVLDQDE